MKKDTGGDLMNDWLQEIVDDDAYRIRYQQNKKKIRLVRPKKKKSE